MMPRSRPPYPKEFREQIVELARTGRTSSELSREFGCSAQTITNWVAQAAIDAGKPLPGKDGLSSAEREELTRLRRENRRLQMERDILAKATAWFAAKGERMSTTSSNS
jgi:transposase